MKKHILTMSIFTFILVASVFSTALRAQTGSINEDLAQNSYEWLIEKGTITYIEPLPLDYKPNHGNMYGRYMVQSAWIKIPNSTDSIAIQFDYHTAWGRDIKHSVSVGKTYRFRLRKVERQISVEKEHPKDLLPSSLKSLPVRNLIDSSVIVIAKEYWLVVWYTEVK